MSSSRSNGDSKEKDLTETTQDENDMPYDSNEQMTIETKRVKEMKIIPKKDLGYLNNGFSLRKYNF